MDYVVGSVAALITGNVTPNRPKLLKRALTPTKHQPSPNVTPKSEFIEDRSIFLSPSVQKKKAIVKKSPKRIFQNPDLETTENGEGNLSLTSPKADKVKKHLKDDLEADSVANQSASSQKSPKNKGKNKKESTTTQESNESITEQDDNEHTPKKKKKKRNLESDNTENVNTMPTDDVSTDNATTASKSPKKKKQRRKSVVEEDSNKENDSSDKIDLGTPTKSEKSPKKQNNKTNSSESTEKSNEDTETSNTNTPKKKNKRRKKKPKAKSAEDSTENKVDVAENINNENIQKENQVTSKKKNKKRKKSKGVENKPEIMDTDEPNEVIEKEDKKSKSAVNPNAITDKESDSEHESDDEIESENEEINKQVLESEKPEESSDEEDEENEKGEKKEVEKKKGDKDGDIVEKNTEEEIKRTLFVGNVPFSAKCKKELKKIFSKHGQIQTIRIRTVPIKDGRYTPKLAVIKNELHPERTTVNVYIKFADEESVEKALVENNTILNENHLRVSRSSSTGAEHDPKCSVFIGNLPFAMEDETLRAKFEKCGEIHSVRIIRDKKTNAGKGFGYVNFESKDGVELALALTEEDLTIKNRILRVKRCTQVTNKKKPVQSGNNQHKGGFRNNQGNQQRGGYNQGQRQGGDFRSGNHQGPQPRGNFRPGHNQDNQQRSGPPSRNNQGFRQRNAAGNDPQRGGFSKFGGQRNLPQKDEEGREGAHRRIMNKRKNQEGAGGDGNDGPPNKRPKDQPKEKKSRKEFVGMTAEKKKKRKFDKGQKKKKVLSEILTK